MVGPKILYFLLYFSILAFPLLLFACITPLGLSFIWESLNLYLFYIGIGLVTSFGKKKIQNLALLFQTGISTYFILQVLQDPLLIHDKTILRFLSFIVFMSLIYFWNLRYHKLLNLWQFFLSLLLSLFFPFICNFYASSLTFSSFVYTHIGYMCDSVNIILALIVGAMICLLKNKWKIIAAFIISIIMALFLSVYLPTGVRSFLIYGSLSGKTNKVVTLSFNDKNMKEITLKNSGEKYSVLLIWDDYSRNHYGKMGTAQYYYWKYKNNEDVCFYVVSINARNKEPFEKYESNNFAVPFYVATDSVAFSKELGVCKEHEFVCLLRNDTLIYRNTMLKVGEYLDELIGKTP